MRGCKVLLIGLGLCVLSGCLAVGVPYTSDPNKKLAYAFQLIHDGRSLPAERLIAEAFETFKANGDQRGMADAYRLYGFFYRSGGVQRHEEIYRERGFRDKTVTFDNRDAKSLESFLKAKDIYTDYKDYANLTNTYLNIGYTYELMYNKKAACAAFDQSLESHYKFLKDKPGAKVNLPTIYKDYPDFVDVTKKENGCDVSLDNYNKLMLILEVKDKNNDSLKISDAVKERIAEAIINKIKQKSQNRFVEINSQASDSTTLRVVITITKYGRELRLFELRGPMGANDIEAEVVLENGASKAQLYKREVHTSASDLVLDILGKSGRRPMSDEDAVFVEVVVDMLLSLVG